MIAYVNVRHSGTGFVVYGLFRGMRTVDIEAVDRADRWDLAWGHIQPHNVGVIREKLAMCDGVFTTLRRGVAQSCLKRGESQDDLAREKSLLYDLMAEREVLTIHLDMPGVRDGELAELNRRFGLALATDWVPTPSLMDWKG